MKSLSRISEDLPLAQQVKLNAKTINELIAFANSLRPISAINERVRVGPDGVLREVTGTNGTGTNNNEPRWL